MSLDYARFMCVLLGVSCGAMAQWSDLGPGWPESLSTHVHLFLEVPKLLRIIWKFMSLGRKVSLTPHAP